MPKKKTLDQIAAEILACSFCRNHTTEQLVPGEGNAKARVMLVGEAPGRQEAATGKPFIGRSGKLLTTFLSEIGIMRETIFITSALKYFPGIRRIAADEITHGLTHLNQQIEIINPEVIVCVGLTAIQAVLGQKYPLQQSHGTFFPMNGRKVFVTYHPAAALRFPKFLPTIRHDLLALKDILS